MGCCPSCYRRFCFCYYCCCDDRPKRNTVSTSPPPKTPSLIPPPSLSPPPQLIVRNQPIQHVPQTHTVKIQTDPLPRSPTPPPPRPVVTDRSTSPIDDIDDRPSSDSKSVYLKHDSSPMANFTNIGLVDHHTDIIVERYKSLSVKSLKEALIGLEAEIHLSIDRIDEIVEKFDKKEDKLLKDEAAAIYLYTMTSEPCISDTLKKAWSSDDPAEIEKWLKYLSLYHKGLGKLEDEQIECWQGNEFNFGWEQELSRKPTKLFTTTGLGTTSKLAIKRHLHKSSDKNIMLIGYKNVHAKDISEYAEDDTYPQYALMPGVHVSVDSFSNQLDTGVITFHIIGEDEPKEENPLNLPEPIVHLKLHFSCPNSFCGRTCDQQHKGKHCKGFSYVRHTCSHHCGGGFRCYNSKCGKHRKRLYLCSGCNQQFCKECCFRVESE